MFHSLKMPLLIDSNLTDLVLLQIELLEFVGVFAMKEIDESEAFREEIMQKCVEHLARNGSRFAEHAQDIVLWLFESRASARNKLLPGLVTAFHQRYDPNVKYDLPLEQRRQWLQRIKSEIVALLKPEKEVLEIKYFYGNGASKPDTKEEFPCWQESTEDFFLFFYKTFLEGDAPLPAELFTDKNAQPFGRKEFLEAFRNENSDLEICPACDEARYYTQSQGKIYTSIDHFLPKDRYPHFACHPYLSRMQFVH